MGFVADADSDLSLRDRIGSELAGSVPYFTVADAYRQAPLYL